MNELIKRFEFNRFQLLLLLLLSLDAAYVGGTVMIASSYGSSTIVSDGPTAASPPAGPQLPDFSEPIRNVTVPLGREAVLSCVISNLAEYKVGWLRADDQTILSLQKRTVTHNPRISVTHDEARTWNLHIRQVKESDQGCYMCQINTAVMKKQLGCITVQVPPDIVDEKSTSDVTVNEGDNVTLTCTATGKPAPRIVWRREDGQKITILSPKGSASGSHGKASWATVKAHQKQQQQQQHDVGLNVLMVADEATLDDAAADASAAAAATPLALHQSSPAGVGGNRERFREVESYQGETLRLYRVTRQMMAAYMCIASNDVPPAVSKRVPLNVNFGPLVAASMNVVGAPVGSDVRLKCTVESHPPSITYWVRGQHSSHEHGMILPNAMNNNKYTIDEERSNGVAAPAYLTTMTLVIRDFQPEDKSAYVCVATNSLGTAEATIQIYEVARPTTSTVYRPPPSSSSSSTRHTSSTITDGSRSGKTSAGHLSDAALNSDDNKHYSRYHDWSSSSSPPKGQEHDASSTGRAYGMNPPLWGAGGRTGADRDASSSSAASISRSHKLLLALVTTMATSAWTVRLLLRLSTLVTI